MVGYKLQTLSASGWRALVELSWMDELASEGTLATQAAVASDAVLDTKATEAVRVARAWKAIVATLAALAC